MKLTKKDEREIDARITQMLRQDAVIGRRIRTHFPNQHYEILRRARFENKLRDQEMRKNVIIKSNPSLRRYPNAD